MICLIHSIHVFPIQNSIFTLLSEEFKLGMDTATNCKDLLKVEKFPKEIEENLESHGSRIPGITPFVQVLEQLYTVLFSLSFY